MCNYQAYNSTLMALLKVQLDMTCMNSCVSAFNLLEDMLIGYISEDLALLDQLLKQPTFCEAHRQAECL
jgi:hypothetical protein